MKRSYLSGAAKKRQKKIITEELAKSKPKMTLWLSKASTSSTDKQG